MENPRDGSAVPNVLLPLRGMGELAGDRGGADKEGAEEVKDTRIVYGARCVWWDSIDKAVALPDGGLPSCPHCHSVLFETDETQWTDGMKKYESEGHPGYVGMMTWSRGKCFPSMAALEAAWKKLPRIPGDGGGRFA